MADPLQQRVEGCERRAEFIVMTIQQMIAAIRALQTQLTQIQSGSGN